MRRARIKRLTGTSLALSATLLVSCMANPGPAPTVDEQDQLADDPADDAASHDEAAYEGEGDADSEGSEDPDSAGTEDDGGTDRSVVSVGIDAFQLGFNPHLVSDNTELVDSIADLVLPSAFNGNFVDTDVLTSAMEVDAPVGVEQRLRYSIKDGAQWSDGTPITGADFEYLWTEMVSTPGVRNVAPYRAISKITTSSGGSVVTVDFSTRVKDWHMLFSHLLPSHLLEPGQFERVLESDIPASAGKFSVASIDQARGMITLNRNDRFWGEDPAGIDVVQLRAIRTTSQAATLLRSGQVSFVDIEPAQTLKEQLSLLGDVHAVNVNPARQLRLNLSTESEVLSTPQLRRTLLSLIDSDQVARLATERTTDLRVPYGGNPLLGTASPDDIAALAAISQDNPVRIAVDPTDAAASNAALTMVDMLRLAGVEANVVENRMTTIIEDSLPEGEVDAVIAGVDTSVTSANMASFFTCQVPEETESTSSTSETTTSAATSTQATERAGAQEQLWSGNLSLACLDEFEATAQSILSGDISARESLALIREVNREQALYLPLIDETRIRAFDSEEAEASDDTEASDDGEASDGADASKNSEGDVDDNADHSEKSIIDWRRGIASAPEWEVNDSDE